MARIAILVALSGAGAFIKIPSPTGTVALDSAPGYLAAAVFSPLEGGIVGALVAGARLLREELVGE